MPLAKSTGAGSPQYLISNLEDFAVHLEERAGNLETLAKYDVAKEESLIMARTMRSIALQLRNTVLKPPCG